MGIITNIHTCADLWRREMSSGSVLPFVRGVDLSGNDFKVLRIVCVIVIIFK